MGKYTPVRRSNRTNRTNEINTSAEYEVTQIGNKRSSPEYPPGDSRASPRCPTAEEQRNFEEQLEMQNRFIDEGRATELIHTSQGKNIDSIVTEEKLTRRKVLQSHVGEAVPLLTEKLSRSSLTPLTTSNLYVHKVSNNSGLKEDGRGFEGPLNKDLAPVEATLPTADFHRWIVYDDNKCVTTKIFIQNSSMGTVLRKVLPYLGTHIENYSFEPPYAPLCHGWEALKNFALRTGEPDLKHAAKSLLNYLKSDVRPFIASMEEIRRTGQVRFDDIWQIFCPNMLVSTTFYGVGVICRIKEYVSKCNDSGRDFWKIRIKYVDWDGEKIGYASGTLIIWEYEGYRRVTRLPVFPVDLEQLESCKASMIERGRKFERFRGYHLAIANGDGIPLERGSSEQERIVGKVCIDAYAYYWGFKSRKPNLLPLYDTEETDLPTTATELFRSFRRAEPLQNLTDDDCLLVIPWVIGFDLEIDQLEPAPFNDGSLEQLVLSDSNKLMITKLFESRCLERHNRSDQGRGLITLLLGPPGTGKNFTVEAIAEELHVPLYKIRASGLGTEAANIRRALERAFVLCIRWNAVLLLNKADDFLGREETVSLLLHMLSYHRGNIFLSASGIERIHPSLRSHLNIVLPYFNLPENMRYVV
ncbi:P-loop containing nucleoside triphosphate hydrolase protein [Xylaria digitata]|nr:P-loop containing nucleoside triphosphate hydrolase protein [Xylaria digitata]